jgi:hypothetical protein
MDKYRLVQEHKGTTITTTTTSIKQDEGAPDGDGGDSSSTQQQQSQQQLQQQQQQKGDSTTTTPTTTTTNMSCEVRITQQGKPRNYITYSMKLFVSQVISSIELNTHLLGSYL